MHNIPKRKLEKCSSRFSSSTQLLKHYSSVHFFTELKAKFPSYFKKCKCTVCGLTVLSEKDKVVHIGHKHNKVKELIRSASVKVENLVRPPPSPSTHSRPETRKVTDGAIQENVTVKVEIDPDLKSFNLGPDEKSKKIVEYSSKLRTPKVKQISNMVANYNYCQIS